VNADMRYARSAYAMAELATLTAPRVAERLQAAPMDVRRLGLPLALAGWEREGRAELVSLVAGWLFGGDGGWGMAPAPPVAPRGAVALLKALEALERSDPGLRSAVETEAERILQAAKVLADAAIGRSGGAGGG
jgi:hypothetical protein